MLLLVIALIALGWMVFAFIWGRDWYAANVTSGLTSSRYATRGPQNNGLFAAPRTASAARLRRQHVLVSLIVAAVLSFAMTRLWSAFWVLHIAVDLALVTFAVALYLRATSGLPSNVGQPRTAPLDLRMSNSTRSRQGWVGPSR